MREKMVKHLSTYTFRGKSIVEEEVKISTAFGLQIRYSDNASATSKADPPELVIESYRDVQRAKTDEQRLKNEAEAYRNDNPKKLEVKLKKSSRGRSLQARGS